MNANRDQVLLLRAALLGGDAGVAAWHEWRTNADLDLIDRGSARLLPLLWFNLLANGVDDPWMPRFKGIYRHTWFGNQVWMRRVRALQSVLAPVGVDALFLKGIALANAYYSNPGLRPMDDLDILISPECVNQAIGALSAGGWQTSFARPGMVLRTRHAIELVSPEGEQLDLHAHLLHGSLNSEVDARRRARARVVDLPDGGRLAVLDPTDQLLHTLVHGVESDPPAPRWLADAVVILRRERNIDWRRLLTDARAEDRTLSVMAALEELTAVFGRENVPVPDGVVAAFAARRTPRFAARVEHRVATGPRIPIVGFALKRAVDYQLWRRSANGDPARAVGFDRYLLVNWGYDERRALLSEVPRRALRTALTDLSAATAQLSSESVRRASQLGR